MKMMTNVCLLQVRKAGMILVIIRSCVFEYCVRVQLSLDLSLYNNKSKATSYDVKYLQ